MSTKTARRAIRALTAIDAYKIDHRRQYPDGTTRVYSNFTPRGSRIPGVDKVVLFGLQAFFTDYLTDAFDDFFAADEDEVTAAYTERITAVLGPNDVGEDHIRALHRLGYVPLRFNALPEGTRVPLRVPMFTVESTHPDFFWLVNYIESVLSAELWLPCTSATQAHRFRALLDDWAARTGGAAAAVDWQGHDFSLRGMEGINGAAMSGAGHLLSFTGTDSLPALDWIEDNYPGVDNGLLGGSVAATEHSVMCAGGDLDEKATFARLLNLYPTGIVSVVSDTWDLWTVLTGHLPALKDQILARDGKLVIRPDSGDPVDILCGTQKEEWADGHSYAKRKVNRQFGEGKTPAEKGVIELLWEIFGGTVNAAGYKELDPHIGAIYGDSINYDRADQVCKRLAEKGFASTNVVLGVGSFTYQYVTRDTFGFAMKATWAEVNGIGRDLFKDPITDDGLKRSARGRIAVLRDADGELELVDQATPAQEAASLLTTVWEDGKLLAPQSFADVRRVLRSETPARELVTA